jgi:cell division protein ZapA (FtsZ GTPase activity inhibitor)
MEAGKQPVRVTIMGKQYTLRASGDPHEVEENAAAVNDLMLSIRSKLGSSDPAQVAVLASLHLADQLRLAEKELEELRQRKDTKSGEYVAMLEKLIASVEELSA